MEGRELNPYEQQLLAVFESCDQDQSGSLDGHGLEQLCGKLQLEEQGYELMKCLLGNTASNKRVTFSEFRDGLLALLAEDQGNQTNRREMGDRGSPEREVSPKFVFGKKKYGRRSRPESTEQDLSLEQEESPDDSDLEIFRTVPKVSLEETESKKKRKFSTSHSPSITEGNLSSWQAPAESGSPSLGHVGENEEECLRAAWERLGVGKDGFLDRRELALVVQQLFEKLDVDRDGRISFEEFLLLFRSGGSWVQTNVVSPSHTETKSNSGRMGVEFEKHSDNSKERKSIGSSSDQDTEFLALDPNSGGYVNAELILEMWEGAGIPGPSQLLQDLGFSESQRLNIVDLAAVLEEELRTLAEDKRNEEAAGSRVQTFSPHETLLQATLALYQTEVRCLKLSLEHMSAERDKLKADIMDANQRASLLAQEIDDHHARLEKSSQLQVKLLEQRHAEQLKVLSEQLGSDREQLAVQNSSLENQVSSLQDEETRLRAQVATLESENEALDKENHSLTEQLSKSEETRIQLQNELESLAGMQHRLSELEGSNEREKMLPLLERINELQAENTGLRDSNDELTMEVESLTAKLASMKTKKSPSQVTHELSEGANVSDTSGISSVMSATKRRGNSPLVLATEDSSEEESPRLGKMRRCCDGSSGDSQDIHTLAHGESGVETDLGLVDYTETSFAALQVVPTQAFQQSQECDSMSSPQKCFNGQNQRSELPDVVDGQSETKVSNFSFLNSSLPSFLNGMISDNLENAKDVEQLEKHCRDLKSQLDVVKIEIVKILSEKKACSKENCALKNHISDLKNQLPTDDSSLHTAENECSQVVSSILGNKNETIESISQKRPMTLNIGAETETKEVCGVVSDSINSSVVGDNPSKIQALEEMSQKLKEEEERHKKEITTVKERCSELENSLELLRQEYEKCEDYWANKLEEERHLYDQEQKLSDEKYAELMSKIKEYEEMLGGQDDQNLEEEFEEFRQRTEIEQTEKEEEIEHLKEQLKFIEQQSNRTESKLNVAVQVSDLENGSWESDRTFVVELDTRSKMPPSSRSSSPPSGPSTYSDNAELRAELIRLHNIKDQLNEECQVLQQQKETLVQEVLDIQAARSQQNGNIGMPFSFPPHWTNNSKVAGQACRVDLNVLQTLNARLQRKEQQYRHLQLTLKQQQKQSESVLKCTWQKHREELNMLQSALHSTQDKLNQKTSACKDQNAYLVATVQRLDQHCHVLVQMTSDSSSV
ncbi:hypothetical protein C0J52_05004 [Blattella germanica]|nr:hypothetical protein C0J52_05004 [Blattella germanica]